MKLSFAGVGGAFCGQNQWQTNAVLSKDDGERRNLLIDCGSDARFSLTELGVALPDIGGVYISHLHADHVGGMEWLAFCTYFNPTLDRLTLFCDLTLMHKMWESTLRGGLDSIEGKVMTLTDYFDCQPIVANGSFKWGDAELTPVQTVHVMAGYQIVHSFGLMISVGPETAQNRALRGLFELTGDEAVADKRKKIFYTSDTQFCPNQIMKFYKEAHLIFQDCEIGTPKSGVHAHYDDLKTLPSEIKRKMWLMHYKSNPPQESKIVGSSDANPEAVVQVIADGFAGFVKKWQEFVL